MRTDRNHHRRTLRRANTKTAVLGVVFVVLAAAAVYIAMRGMGSDIDADSIEGEVVALHCSACGAGFEKTRGELDQLIAAGQGPSPRGRMRGEPEGFVCPKCGKPTAYALKPHPTD